MLVRRAALLALLPLSLAACDQNLLSKLHLPGQKPEAAAPAPVAPAAARPPAVSPLEVPIEVAGEKTAIGTANAAFVGVKAFTASGANWVAAVDGNYAALRRQGARDANIAVRRVDFGQGAEFVGTLAERTVTLNLRNSACRDAAGLTWPMTATVRASGGNLSGCAAPTGHEPKGFAVALPTVKAVAAPKPAAPKAAPKKTVTKVAPKPAAPAPVTPAPATATPLPTAPAPATTTPATTPTTPAPAPAASPTTTTTPTPAAPAASSTTTTTTTPTPEPAASSGTSPAAPTSGTSAPTAPILPILPPPPAGTTPAVN